MGLRIGVFVVVLLVLSALNLPNPWGLVGALAAYVLLILTKLIHDETRRNDDGGE